jgi:hypothetical protein
MQQLPKQITLAIITLFLILSLKPGRLFAQGAALSPAACARACKQMKKSCLDICKEKTKKHDKAKKQCKTLCNKTHDICLKECKDFKLPSKKKGKTEKKK